MSVSRRARPIYATFKSVANLLIQRLGEGEIVAALKAFLTYIVLPLSHPSQARSTRT